MAGYQRRGGGGGGRSSSVLDRGAEIRVAHDDGPDWAKRLAGDYIVDTAADCATVVNAAIAAAATDDRPAVILGPGVYDLGMANNPNNANYAEGILTIPGVAFGGVGRHLVTLKGLPMQGPSDFFNETPNTRYWIGPLDLNTSAPFTDDIEIFGFTLDGNSNHQRTGGATGSSTSDHLYQHHGIKAFRGRRVWIHDVLVKNVRGTIGATAAIVGGGTSQRYETFHIDANECGEIIIERVIIDSDDGGDTATGLACNACEQVTYRDFVTRNMDRHGWALWTVDHAAVLAGRSYNNGENGGRVELSKKVSLSEVWCGGLDRQTGGALTPDAIAGNAGNGLNIKDSDDVTAVNSHFNYNTLVGVEINGARGGGIGSGCTIENNGSYGFKRNDVTAASDGFIIDADVSIRDNNAGDADNTPATGQPGRRQMFYSILAPPSTGVSTSPAGTSYRPAKGFMGEGGNNSTPYVTTASPFTVKNEGVRTVRLWLLIPGAGSEAAPAAGAFAWTKIERKVGTATYITVYDAGDPKLTTGASFPRYIDFLPNEELRLTYSGTQPGQNKTDTHRVWRWEILGNG